MPTTFTRSGARNQVVSQTLHLTTTGWNNNRLISTTENSLTVAPKTSTTETRSSNITTITTPRTTTVSWLQTQTLKSTTKLGTAATRLTTKLSTTPARSTTKLSTTTAKSITIKKPTTKSLERGKTNGVIMNDMNKRGEVGRSLLIEGIHYNNGTKSSSDRKTTINSTTVKTPFGNTSSQNKTKPAVLYQDSVFRFTLHRA